MRPWEALVIGMVGGAIAVGGPPLFDRLRIDDPVGAITVHGLCGFWVSSSAYEEEIWTHMFAKNKHSSGSAALAAAISFWLYPTLNKFYLIFYPFINTNVRLVGLCISLLSASN